MYKYSNVEGNSFSHLCFCLVASCSVEKGKISGSTHYTCQEVILLSSCGGTPLGYARTCSSSKSPQLGGRALRGQRFYAISVTYRSSNVEFDTAKLLFVPTASYICLGPKCDILKTLSVSMSMTIVPSARGSSCPNQTACMGQCCSSS